MPKKTTLSKNPRSPFFRLRFIDPRTKEQVTRTSKLSDHSEALKSQTLLRQASKAAKLTGNFTVFDNLVTKMFGLDEVALPEDMIPVSVPPADESKKVISWDEFISKTFKAKGDSDSGGWSEEEGLAFLRNDRPAMKAILQALAEEKKRGSNPRFKVRQLADLVSRISNLAAYFGERNMLELQEKDVSDFISNRKKQGAKGGTINRDTTVLNNLYRYAAVTEGLRELKNPYNSLLHKQKEPKPHISIWLENRKSDFLDACSDISTFNSFPMVLLSDIAIVDWTTGCRIEELLTLTVGQVHLNEGVLALVNWDTKNGKFRNVQMRTEEVREILKRNMEGKTKDDLVFSWAKKGNRGKGDFEIRYNAIQKAFQAACSKAGIAGEKIHNWRKTAVTVQMFAIDGMSETEIMVEMQWSDQRLLNSYLDRGLAVQLRKQHLARTSQKASQPAKTDGRTRVSALKEGRYALQSSI